MKRRLSRDVKARPVATCLLAYHASGRLASLRYLFYPAEHAIGDIIFPPGYLWLTCTFRLMRLFGAARGASAYQEGAESK